MSRPVPAFLKALGTRQLPEQIDVRGESYRRSCVLKDDFFAVTAVYEGSGRRVILKVGRQAALFLFPMTWIGRLLAAREEAALLLLADVHGVPRLVGRWGPAGIVREFLEGRPLRKGEPVPDDFHSRLRALIDEIHARDMAYVDLEKCENVLLGDDGRPYLFDFQIAWHVPRRWGGELWPIRRFRSFLQAGDRYHLLKLQRRTRPDQLTPDQIAASYRKPWTVRLHRLLTAPFLKVRRMALDRIDPRRDGRERGTVAS